MTLIEDILIYGAITGAVYALLALGFTLIYGVAEILNMSHGVLYMLGAYMFVAFNAKFFQLGLLPSSILAVIFVGFVGIAIYALIHQVIEETLAVLVVTLGATLVVQQLIRMPWAFGGSHVAVPSLLEGHINFLGAAILYDQILAFVLALGLFVVVWTFITRSKIGGAMRAVAQDREAAMLMGINTERLYIITMFISATLAAIAGLLIARPVIHPFTWQTPLVMSFAIVVLGGLGSIKGSFVGAFIVGYAEISVIYLVPSGEYLRGAVALAVMVVVLIFRPAGLFGKRMEIEE